MKQQRIYSVKEIVWAKIQQYPWWPGRIVSSIQQKNKKIYKINFFGDPTYCFLSMQSLLPFNHYQFNFNNNFQIDSKLKKSIQLAKKAFLKNQNQQKQIQIQINQPYRPILQQSTIFQETKISSKHDIEIPQKIYQEKQIQNTAQDNYLDLPYQTNIHTNNIISLLQSGITNQIYFDKGLKQKKQIITYIKTLQQTLLEKYNLKNIQKKQIINIKLQKKHKLIKKNKNKSIQYIKKQSIKILYNYLLNKNISKQKSKNLSISIINKIENITNGINNNFKNTYLQFNRLIKKINSFDNLQEILENQSNNNYLGDNFKIIQEITTRQ